MPLSLACRLVLLCSSPGAGVQHTWRLVCSTLAFRRNRVCIQRVRCEAVSRVRQS